MDLSKDDKFIVIASDGVWEFITNEEVAKARQDGRLRLLASKMHDAAKEREALRRAASAACI